MKLIKQSFEFINQTDFSLVGIKKHIERCARVSYKSENKITDTSYEKFVNMLESRGHDRPLEFGTVYLSRTSQKEDNMEWLDKYAYNPWSKFSFGNGSTRINGELRNTVYVTTNYRVIKQHHWEDDLQYLCEPTEYHYKRYTIHMILDRGVMDEFRTHVGLSHLAEVLVIVITPRINLAMRLPLLNHASVIFLKETMVRQIIFLIGYLVQEQQNQDLLTLFNMQNITISFFYLKDGHLSKLVLYFL